MTCATVIAATIRESLIAQPEYPLEIIVDLELAERRVATGVRCLRTIEKLPDRGDAFESICHKQLIVLTQVVREDHDLGNRYAHDVLDRHATSAQRAPESVSSLAQTLPLCPGQSNREVSEDGNDIRRCS